MLRSYDTEVSVREPKVVNDFDGVGMRRWTVSVNTNIARPDLPKQRIKLEIASVPAHTSTVRRVAVNYPELAGMYDDLTIRCQTLEEILADKLISFSATDTHIRHRDLWDIPWIVRAQELTRYLAVKKPSKPGRNSPTSITCVTLKVRPSRHVMLSGSKKPSSRMCATTSTYRL